MTSLEEKYPAHKMLMGYLANIKADDLNPPSIFGFFGCYYGSVYDVDKEFNQLLEQNRQQAAKIERYERALKDISNTGGYLSGDPALMADQALNYKD